MNHDRRRTRRRRTFNHIDGKMVVMRDDSIGMRIDSAQGLAHNFIVQTSRRRIASTRNDGALNRVMEI